VYQWMQIWLQTGIPFWPALYSFYGLGQRFLVFYVLLPSWAFHPIMSCCVCHLVLWLGVSKSVRVSPYSWSALILGSSRTGMRIAVWFNVLFIWFSSKPSTKFNGTRLTTILYLYCRNLRPRGPPLVINFWHCYMLEREWLIKSGLLS